MRTRRLSLLSRDFVSYVACGLCPRLQSDLMFHFNCIIMTRLNNIPALFAVHTRSDVYYVVIVIFGLSPWHIICMKHAFNALH